MTSGAPVVLWHVTITMGGDALDEGAVLDSLRRLADEQPFLLSGRYGRDRAEIVYWEEAADCADAAALALRLWGEHRASAGLPSWRVLGLEVVGEELRHTRGEDRARVAAVGTWRRF
jgi:hypothetical protein